MNFLNLQCMFREDGIRCRRVHTIGLLSIVLARIVMRLGGGVLGILDMPVGLGNDVSGCIRCQQIVDDFALLPQSPFLAFISRTKMARTVAEVAPAGFL